MIRKAEIAKRYELTATQQKRIAPPPSGKAWDAGRDSFDNSLFMDESVALAPSRDLQERCGAWRSLRERVSRWAKADVRERVFEALIADPKTIV